MKNYPPSHLTPKESKDRVTADEQLTNMDVSDDALKQYAKGVIDHYRAVIESHFEKLAPYLALYRQYPYEITVVRIDQGTFIGYKAASKPSVDIKRLEDFDPPIKTLNLFELQDRLASNLITFDFSFRSYDSAEAEAYGTRMALSDALHFLWLGIDAATFERLCLELLEAEGLTEEITISGPPNTEFDTAREVTLNEPGGFRRVERWAFEFKHHKDNRVSAKDLRELEMEKLQEPGLNVDAFCLITSGDLTTIGRNVAVENPRVRVWDRDVLNRLVNKHLSILEGYFSPYPRAIKALTEQFAGVSTSRYDEFKQRLEACPTGLKHSTEYETIGTELWEYVFEGKLGVAKPQRRTSDGVQRRDSLFPNLRNSRFFQRVFDRFDADFVIVDFKNSGKPVTSGPIEEARNYANAALGKFVVVVARKGGSSAAMKAQIRLLRDGIAVLALSDAQMLEMIIRKERGEDPEDVLTDLLDELLIKF